MSGRGRPDPVSTREMAVEAGALALQRQLPGVAACHPEELRDCARAVWSAMSAVFADASVPVVRQARRA